MAAASTASSAGALKPGEIEVTVLNGTAVPGLAASYGDKVERKGFKLGAVTNSSASFAEQRRHVQTRPRPRSAPRREGPRDHAGAADDLRHRLGLGRGARSR